MHAAALSFDLLSDVRQLLAYPFMVNALEGATVVAVVAAVVGWYMVLRRQSFAGHTLSLMAFPGAAGAALVGLPATLGYYLACGLAAVSIGGARGRGYRNETAAVGTVQAVGLGAGFLFLTLNRAVLGSPESLLFGNVLGITRGQVAALVAVAIGVVIALTVLGRPLLFATVDPDVARANGVPVSLLDVSFLLILALAVAATSQITGALLVFALLVAPPASAQALTMRPVLGLVLSVCFGLVVTWLGLGIAYFSIYPVGFFTTTFAFGLYLIARMTAWTLKRRRTGG